MAKKTFLTDEDEKRFVKKVNGQTPDENGNVEIEIPEAGGTGNYSELTNKPSINGVTLEGNKTAEDLGIPAPTAEQVSSAVSDWLDANPEATTTVQDGSITERKLSASVIRLIAGNAVFEGLTAFFFGDSLTEQNYHYTKGYHKWVKELLGLASYNNYGVSGYKVSDVYNKVKSTSGTAPLVFVMCGVNDQNFSVPLGEMGDNTTGTTYGALSLLCAELKSKYPTSIIVFITPHYQTKYPHSSGVTSYEVSKAILAVCEKFAIPVYDNFVLSGIYSTNLSAFTTDNCHWNDKGHEMVGKNLAAYMLNTFHYVHDGDETPDATDKTLTGISAVYSGGSVPVGTAVSALTGVAVTAHYSDGSTAIVTGYTLSGSIAEGDNTVTVSYGGMTATFTVTGIAKPGAFDGTLNIINNSLNTAAYDGGTLTLDGLNQTFGGVLFNGATALSLNIDSNNPDTLFAPSMPAFGWFIVQQDDGLHAIGALNNQIETYDFMSDLTNPGGRKVVPIVYPSSGVIHLKIKGDAVNLYFGDDVAYSTTGDAIGYARSAAKTATLHDLTII